MRFASRDILGSTGPVARAIGGDGYEARQQQLDMAAAVERTLASKGRLIVEAGTGVGKSFAYLVPAILRCIAPGKTVANSSGAGGGAAPAPGGGERVLVATNTIALQEQLVRKDIPLLAESLGDGSGWGLDPATTRKLVPVLVKGRGNYVSIRRLKLASQRQDRLFSDPAARRSLHVLEDWALETLDGSLSSLPAGIERMSVWDRVQSDSDNCMGRKCDHFEECFYQKSRRAMESANLLICNHAVFFSDLAMRATGLNGGAGFLPDYQHVILDEAHNAEDVACDHFGLGLTESRVEHFLGVLYHSRSGKGYLTQLDNMASGIGKGSVELSSLGTLKATVDAAAHATLKALDASRAFFDALHAVARSRDPALLRSGRIMRPNLVDNPLSPAMRSLAASLKVLRERIKSEPDRFELNAYSIRAEAIAFDADALVSHSREGYVYWLEGGQSSSAPGGEPTDEPAPGDQPERTHFPAPAFSARGPNLLRGKTRIKLACSPIEVAPALREHFWSREIGIVLCSATLAISGSGTKLPATTGREPDAATDPADFSRRIEPIADDGGPADPAAPAVRPARPKAPVAPRVAPAFVHVAERLGCDAADTLQLGSPFDHARQAEVYVDLSVPDPRVGPGRGPQEREQAQRAYNAALAARVLHHVRETEGGAFVLFTSFATLRAVAEIIDPLLAREGFPLLVQGRDGPAGRLVEEFRKDDRSVLLGAASIWQGVDVKGRGLRNVIIVKLPFDPPDRPIVEARGERLRARGRSPFADDALPRAILRFKQGFGRLIRSQTDFGRVVVLDARVVNTAYGQRFLAALPPGVRIKTLEVTPRAETPDADRHWVPLEE